MYRQCVCGWWCLTKEYFQLHQKHCQHWNCYSEIKKLEKKLNQAKTIIEDLSDRHRWISSLRKCGCHGHREAKKFLNKKESE